MLWGQLQLEGFRVCCIPRETAALAEQCCCNRIHAPILPPPQGWLGTAKGSSAAEKMPLPQPRSLPGCCRLREGLALAGETGLGITDLLPGPMLSLDREKEKREDRDMLHPHSRAPVLICITKWPHGSFWRLWNLCGRDSSPRTNNTCNLKIQIPLTLPSCVLQLQSSHIYTG